MKVISKKQELRWKRRKRIRKKVVGNAQRPRLCVFRSHKHIYIQLIDDMAGRTLFSVSTLTKDLRDEISNKGGTVDAARVLGKYIAQQAKEKGFKRLVFDRSGYQFKGRIQALAQAAREDGLEL